MNRLCCGPVEEHGMGGGRQVLVVVPSNLSYDMEQTIQLCFFFFFFSWESGDKQAQVFYLWVVMTHKIV